MTPEKLALKRAFAETVKGCGGLEAAAGFCRVGKSTLADNGSVNHPESFPALDVIADLEPLARERDGWPHVTTALCQMMGGTFVPLPDAVATGADLLQLLAGQSKEMSDLTTSIANGLSDQRICAADARKSLKEAREVVALAAVMVAELELIANEGDIS